MSEQNRSTRNENREENKEFYANAEKALAFLNADALQKAQELIPWLAEKIATLVPFKGGKKMIFRADLSPEQLGALYDVCVLVANHNREVIRKKRFDDFVQLSACDVFPNKNVLDVLYSDFGITTKMQEPFRVGNNVTMVIASKRGFPFVSKQDRVHGGYTFGYASSEIIVITYDPQDNTYSYEVLPFGFYPTKHDNAPTIFCEGAWERKMKDGVVISNKVDDDMELAGQLFGKSDGEPRPAAKGFLKFLAVMQDKMDEFADVERQKQARDEFVKRHAAPLTYRPLGALAAVGGPSEESGETDAE